MKHRKNKTIIYVNYAPYENAGKILDYLLENYSTVCLFSLGFHSLVNRTNYNNLQIYSNGKLIKTFPLVQIPVIKKLIFLSIPFQSVLTFLNVVAYTWYIRRIYKKVDLYFTVNAFTAWIGMLLKKAGLVKKTMFWVWDYYPPFHENYIISLMRRLYWQFDKVSSHSDIVVFQNKMLLDLRKNMGIYHAKSTYLIVPLGTDNIPYAYEKRNFRRQPLTFGFIGVLKKSQGMEIVFNYAKALRKEFPNIRYEIVGSGPDEAVLKGLAVHSGIHAKFHGYLEGETFNEVLRSCDIGIATYVPDDGNVSPYGDPGKIKRYLSLGVPVITTNIHKLCGEVEKLKAGKVVDYSSQSEFVNAVKTILSDHSRFSRQAYLLSQKFYFRKIYPVMFEGI